MTSQTPVRWYRRLLRVYPRPFQERFADGMTYAFAQELDRARSAGRFALLQLWVETLWHTLLGALDARKPAFHSRRSPVRSTLALDLRDAFRALRSTPLVSCIAILSLALGIGSNTALFSIVDSLLLKSLPVHEPERLVLVAPGEYTNPIWEAIRSREDELAGGMFAWSFDRFNLATGGETEFVNGLRVSGRAFDVMGVHAIAGRTLTMADDVRGGSPGGPAAVLGYGYWQRRYGWGSWSHRSTDPSQRRDVHDRRGGPRPVLRTGSGPQL